MKIPFDNHFIFHKLELELGKTISLIDQMLISNIQYRKHIVFEVTPGNIIKSKDFFKKAPLDFMFIQNNELLICDHIDFEKPFFAYSKTASCSNKITGKKLHQFYVYTAEPS